MDKTVLDWITKISKTYAQCNCGKLCHIDVTIKKDMLTYRAYCPNCNKIYTQYQSIYVFKDFMIADVEDILIDKIRREFKWPCTICDGTREIMPDETLDKHTKEKGEEVENREE